jgi:hypothetical protein
MHIGIDFDNTVVIYDDVFYKHALQSGLIPSDTAQNKQVIRDTIRLLPDGNDKWTELQGLVYGLYMEEAQPAVGFESFLAACKDKGVGVSIISHKTIYPAKGPKVNLQDAAKKWVKNRGFYSKFGLTREDVVFEETLQGKLEQIEKKGCTHFIEDLSEVLLHPSFPNGVERLLYSQAEITDGLGLKVFRDWGSIQKYFFG